MIELEKEFVSGAGGFSANPLTYTQIKRTEKAAVYMRSQNGLPYDYETFLIKIKSKGEYPLPNGKVQVLTDDTEQYPTSSLWGRIAWSYTNIGLAMVKFHELIHGTVNEEPHNTTDDEVFHETSKEDAVAIVNAGLHTNVPEKSNSDDLKPYKGQSLLIPVGEFSTKQLAEHNKVQYPIAFLFRKEMERSGKIKFHRKQKAEGRGKPTDIFVSI